jgi:low temperature requirement protein LtrA
MLNALNETYTQLVAFYLAARLFVGAYYVYVSFAIPMVRGMMVMQAIMVVVPCGMWIASIYVDMPSRLTLIWISIFLDLFASTFVIVLIRGSKIVSSWLAEWTENIFEFYPAVNIEHKTARTDAFVTLIFGYSVVALFFESSAGFGVNAFFGKAVLGLIQAFCMNTLYFEIDGDSLWQHAIRRSVTSCEYTFQYTLLSRQCQKRIQNIHRLTTFQSPVQGWLGYLSRS